jgi:hypothetical protein
MAAEQDCDCTAQATLTPKSACQPFALAADLFVYHTPEEIGDFVRDGQESRPASAVMSDPTSQYGSIVYKHLMLATGRILAEAQVGKRYQPCDIINLVQTTGNQGFIVSGGQLAIQMTCDIAFFTLACRKRPMGANLENIPGVKQTFDLLKLLAKGEAIFSFEESAQAGLPEVVQAQPYALFTPNIVRRCERVFPNFGSNSLPNNPGMS